MEPLPTVSAGDDRPLLTLSLVSFYLHQRPVCRIDGRSENDHMPCRIAAEIRRFLRFLGDNNLQSASIDTALHLLMSLRKSEVTRLLCLMV